MSRFINSHLLYVLISISVLMIILTSIFRGCSSRDKVVFASITPTSAVVGESVLYADSTKNANEWLWEFGNGDMSSEQRGSYIFRQAGTYKVRLTVDGRNERFFDIVVKERTDSYREQNVSIIAPTEAVQYENIVFRGIGNDEQWRWEFGESGIIDSREKSPIYAYMQPGIYTVRLTTENTRYPILHTLEVIPSYSEGDSTDVMTLIGLDIKEKLQFIADRKGSFNLHYNHIVNKYLNAREDIIVVINNTKRNDIYSYCQGLRMEGRGNVLINQVIVEIPDVTTGYVERIIVIQQDKESL